VTIIGRRHGQGDDLLGQQIDLARLHDGFEARPAQLEMFRMAGQCAPDIRDAIFFVALMSANTRLTMR